MARPHKTGEKWRADLFAYMDARDAMKAEGLAPTVEQIATRAGMSRATAFRVRGWVRDIERGIVRATRALLAEHPELADMTAAEAREWERSRKP